MALRTTLFATAAVLALSATADAAPNGWYVSLEGGASWVQDINAVEFNGTTYLADIEMGTGWAALGTIGYGWDRWRFEVEAGYRHNDVDFLLFSTGSSFFDIGELQEFSLMANVLYDIPLGKSLSLTIGAGAGADRINFKWDTFGSAGLDEEDWAFAYQGIVGLNYALSPQLEAFVNYRYLNVSEPDFAVAGATFDFDDVTKHSATLGLRYHFGQ